MSQLTDSQQLTLEAFHTAVQLLRQRQIPLPESIEAIASDPASHINQLDSLSETNSEFEQAYQTARIILQSQAGERSKRYTGGTAQRESPAHYASPTMPPTNTNGHSIHEAEGPYAARSPSAKIQRFALQTNATAEDRQYFERYITQLTALNPEWIVALDYCRPGEAEAYVMIYNDENYSQNHALYLADQALNRVF